ncbi:MAG TPA: type II toxin-antitoxin system VapC family toxin [Anaerolineales bacterium]
MILYMDTSALVKRYIREARSDEVIEVIEQSEAVGSSVFTRVEMAATFAKAVRLDWVEDREALHVWKDYLDHWPSFARIVVSTGVVERASELAWEYGLRGYDAMHFASALLWQDALASPITLATFDRGLWLAAQKSGMEVWPLDLDQ